ncbi:DUF6268 family outer membrane beta-barrel protein [Aureivirga sp. CE67]|uniref:DUF6268 family outer membrane beta-barrel protein n=1 Tax=Aureivirga sp. CE67 TaxID=1788983 RepID=UPI0018C9097D|nr:DUF6268 family outer membrane beta-barrel protein [Aureivirga sp. CE67]
MKNKIAVLCMLFLCFNVVGQDLELMKFSYDLQSLGDVDYNKSSLKLKLPTKVGENYFIHGIDAEVYDFSYDQNILINKSELSEVYNFSYALNYFHKLSDVWSFHTYAKISLSSTLESSVTSSDLFPTGGLFFHKRKGKKNAFSHLSLGVAYTARFGKPMLVPVVRYTKKVNEKFLYTLGLPSTHLKYNFDKKRNVKFGVELSGMQANISNPFLYEGKKASDIALNTGTLGLEYNYKLSKSWSIFGKAGYTLWNNYSLLDDDKEEVYNFDTTNGFSFSTGIKFNFTR